MNNFVFHARIFQNHSQKNESSRNLLLAMKSENILQNKTKKNNGSKISNFYKLPRLKSIHLFRFRFESSQHFTRTQRNN